MILTIDGKLHHLKELDFIERQVYDIIEPKEFYSSLRDFFVNSPDVDLRTKKYLTFEEVEHVDNFIKNYFFTKLPEINLWFIRAYVVGRLLAESDQQATIFSLEAFNALPKTVQEAVKQYDLTLTEAKALERAMATAGVDITNCTASTIQQVRQAVFQSIQNNEGVSGVLTRLQRMIVEDKAELNRDWTRVAIYEVNSAFSNGYLNTLQDGEYVYGISMPDACPHCLDMINGKIYRVTKTPPPDFANLTGEEFEKYKKIWETYVWEGKNNIGRSSSKQKRIDKEKGNTKDNLTSRAQAEMIMPAIPLHPYCRCRWIYFNPKFQWVDNDGNLRLAIEDREAHKQWYINNIEE